MLKWGMILGLLLLAPAPPVAPLAVTACGVDHPACHPGDYLTFTVALSGTAHGPVTGGFFVALLSGKPSLVPLPASVNVPGGSSVVAVGVRVPRVLLAEPQSVLVSASGGGKTVSTTVTISSLPPPPVPGPAPQPLPAPAPPPLPPPSYAGPRLAIDPPAFTVFYLTSSNTADVRILTLRNEGSGVLTGTVSPLDSADFSFTVPPALAAGKPVPFALHTGDIFLLGVRFAPTGAGEKTATFLVQSNDPGGPATIRLQAEAAPPPKP